MGYPLCIGAAPRRRRTAPASYAHINLVVQGDSLTAKNSPPISTPTPWPERLSGFDYTLANLSAYGGRLVADMRWSIDDDVVPYFDETAGVVNVAMLLQGGNDMMVENGEATPQELLDLIAAWATAVQAAGWKAVTATMTERYDLATQVSQYNTLLRASTSSFDLVVDMAAFNADPPAGYGAHPRDEIYYWPAPDVGHWQNTLGHQTAADIISPQLRELAILP